MKLRALLVLALLLLAACSKVTPDNFARLQDGMSEEEVTAILGKPTETSSTSMLNISSTTSRWAGKDVVVVVRFLNGKMMLKTLDQKPVKK